MGEKITKEKLEILYKLYECASLVHEGVHPRLYDIPKTVFEEFVDKYNISFQIVTFDDDAQFLATTSGKVNLFSENFPVDSAQTEVTLEEVAKALDVPVEKLRIKEK